VVVVEVLVSGDEPVFTVVFDSVLVELAGDSLITVVSFSVLFSAGGFVTVVSFCSQAARHAMLAKTQTYLIMIMLIRTSPAGCVSTEWLMENQLWSYRRDWMSSLWWWSSYPRRLRSGWQRAPRFQFFAHMPQAGRRRLKCRCISS
jgi:hypothetical protein